MFSEHSSNHEDIIHFLTHPNYLLENMVLETEIDNGLRLNIGSVVQNRSAQWFIESVILIKGGRKGDSNEKRRTSAI